MIWIILIGLTILGLWLYFKFFKLYKIKNLIFIDGGLGTGKSVYSVYLAVRLYKRQLFRYKLKKWVLPLLAKFSQRARTALEELEEPFLYSNIKLRNVKFVPLTKDILLRKKRPNYKSVVLFDEFSLVASQFDYKNREISERLTEFFKLFRHETKGGYAIINSQSSSDLHYSVKYVLTDYLYIHHKYKVPFFTFIKVQEMAYCADKDGYQITNVTQGDIEQNLVVMGFLNKYYKYYDPYCYSIFTDDLDREQAYLKLTKKDSLKQKKIVSFREYNFLMEKKNEE